MKLKSSILSVLFLCLVFSINAQDRETKTHTVKDVKSIAVNGNVDIHIKQGNSKTVKIEASEKQHEKMEVDINGSSVSVSCKGGKKNDKPVKVYVEVQNLNALASSSGADVYLENTIKSDELSIALSGGSDMSGSVDVNKLNCATSAGSDLDLKEVTAKKYPNGSKWRK